VIEKVTYMAIEIAHFDADSIQTELDRDLAGGLRMLADAIDGGMLTGRLTSAEGIAGGARDERIHMLLKVVVSSAARTVRRIENAPQLEIEINQR
jgi:hypothetical protein